VVAAAIAVLIFVGGLTSGGSFNPGRQLGPLVFVGRFSYLWAYLLGPITGAVILAVLVRLPRPLTAACTAHRRATRNPSRSTIRPGGQGEDQSRMPGIPTGRGSPWHAGDKDGQHPAQPAFPQLAANITPFRKEARRYGRVERGTWSLIVIPVVIPLFLFTGIALPYIAGSLARRTRLRQPSRASRRESGQVRAPADRDRRRRLRRPQRGARRAAARRT
jgi:hypothetical protein